MAVVNLKGSRNMTGLDSTPKVMADPGDGGGMVRCWTETVETNADDSVSSTYLFARLPSNAKILGQSHVYWDDLATTGSPLLDMGVFNQSGQSDITDDPDALTNGLALASATNGKLIDGIQNYGLALWDFATGSTDPSVDLDIKGTLTDAAITEVGTITVEIYYTLD